MLTPVRVLVGLGLVLGLLLGGCLFGGGDDTPSADRPGSIPTATPPANLPEPLQVGETQAGSGGSTTGAGAGESTYAVKLGDTLTSIAAQFGVPAGQQAAWIQEVLRLNGIAEASQLQANVTLRVPSIPATPRPTGTVTATAVPRTPTPQPTTPPATATSPPATSTPSVGGGAGTYTVVSGDNPTAIGEKLGVPASQLAAWADQLVGLNNISPAGLQVGQVLQLPPIPTAATSTPTP
jgi:LysM repeat protein